MNKRNLYLFLYLLLPLLFIIPPVLAVPDVNITLPAGGEIFSGSILTTFNVSDADAPQSVFDANLYYSAGGTKENLIIQDLNLFNACDFTDGYIISSNNEIVGTGLGTPSGLREWVDLTVVDGNLVAIMRTGASTWETFWWNESDSTWWETPSGSDFVLPAGKTYRAFDFFNYGGESYGLITSFLGLITDTNGYKWNSTTEVWDSYEPISIGLSGTADDYPLVSFSSISVVEFSGELILFQNDFNSWVWDGSEWNIDNRWNSNFHDLEAQEPEVWNKDKSPPDYFVKDGVLWAMSAYKQAGDAFYSESTGLWTIANLHTPDINAIINQTVFHYIGVETGYDSSIQVISWEDTTNAWDAFEINASAILTNKSTTCSYTWDISSVANFPNYTFEVAPFTSTSSGFEQSLPFAILNWTDSDITCECISNCSSCVLDVNTFVIVPINESNDVEIKVENLTSEKIVGYKMVNSQDTGNQYKIHTSEDGSVWALNDTLTFGSTAYNSIQKIWQTNTQKYNYLFSETLTIAETKYYKFDYYEPAYHWFTVNDSYWDVQLTPFETDFNGTKYDLYVLSTYSDLTNFLTTPRFPALTSDLSNKNYVFQFTAKGDTEFSAEFNAGIVIEKENTSPTSLNFLNRFRTTTLTGLENGFLKMESSVSTPIDFSIQNYVVTERGYFTKPLRLTQTNGSPLPIAIGDNNTQFKYVIEGKNFTIITEYNDPDGEIDRYEITAYVDSVDSANKIKKWLFNADQNGLITIKEDIGGLIDLTPNAPDRTVIITIRLIDTSANYYEIQTEKIKLRQFPANRQDITFNISQGSQRIGEYPKGRITLQTIAPENIIGVNLRFQDMTTDNNNADFNITFYKGTDFSCTTFDCSFDYEIKEFILSTTGFFRVDAWALVTTEEQKSFSPFNDLLHDFKPFIVSWIAFDTARIFQTIERSDNTYRNDEVIPLVVQLRDSTGLPRTLAKVINVILQLEECDSDTPAGQHCRTIDLNYSQNGKTIFDERTGYTYFHFRQIFLEEDYTPLSDGNYFRVKAIISDPTKTYETLYIPVLANKCQVVNPLVYVANMLTMDYFKWGCESGEFTKEITALPDNNAHEAFLLIDEDHSVTAPTQYWWMCNEPNRKGLYSDDLAQDIICMVYYNLGEAPIDEFNFYLTNDNSDLSETDDNLKQYIEVSVPFEYIAFNDMRMTKASLQQEFTTDWTDENPPSVSEIALYLFQHFLGSYASQIFTTDNFLGMYGTIGNMGFEMGAVEEGNTVDFNFATPFDPRTVSGVLVYKIQNLNVINKKDYEKQYPEIKNLSATNFSRWANEANVRLRSKPITIGVFVSDNVKIMEVESNAKLIIDEVVTANKINIENADVNADQNIFFDSIPTTITFRAISDMIYNNHNTFKRRYLILPFTFVLESKTMCGWFGINCWDGGDGECTISTFIEEGDTCVFALNAFGLFVILGTLLIVSVVYRNFRRRSVGG